MYNRIEIMILCCRTNLFMLYCNRNNYKIRSILYWKGIRKMRINGKVVGYSVLIITWILAILFFSKSCITQRKLDQELIIRVEQVKKEAAEAEAKRKEEEQKRALLEEQKKERIVFVKTLPIFESNEISVNQTAEPKARLLSGDKVLLVEEGNPYSFVQSKEKDISGFVWSDGIGKLPESGSIPSRVIVIDAGGQQHIDLEKEPIRPESDTMVERMKEGAVGCSTEKKEYEMTLAVALKLEQELENYDFTVIQIRRDSNVSISHAERAGLANQIEADVYLQLAGDFSEDSDKKGASASYAEKEEDDVNKRLAELVLAAYTDEMDAISKNTVEKSEEDTALNWCNVPSALLKLGYLSNEEEDRCINDSSMQQKMAEGIAKGLFVYFNREEENGE